MSDEMTNVAPGGGESAPAITVITPATDGPMSAREAADLVSSTRHERQKKDSPDAPQREAAAEPPDGAQAQELADEANAAPHEGEAPGETTTEAEPAAEPPIEPPRSWTKEEKAAFEALPRDHQQRIADRERAREVEIRRSQNETAEQRKAVEADRAQAAQARQQYEAALPILMQTLQESHAGQFSDIKSMADVERLAGEDPYRFAQWQASQMKLAAIQKEADDSERRQATERAQKWQEFAQREDSLFAEKVPNVDQKQRDAAVTALKDIGFKDSELTALWTGQEKVSLRDHRFQLILLDAVKYRGAQAAAKAAAAKPVPAVATQRPGTARPGGASKDQALQALKQKAEQSGNPRDFAAFVAARRAAR